MINETKKEPKIKGIKVPAKIKPLPLALRKEPPLVIGNMYYVCFGSNKVFPCKLVEVEEREIGAPKSISIEITNVTPSRLNGLCSMRSDEIGLTPEEAVKNKFM